MTTGIIFDIKRFAIHDGPGIRTTIFFKGCPMKCHWCHNPESQSPHIQPMGDQGVTGREVTVDEIMDEIEKETLFHDQSGGGVTFSGGEPLNQPRFVEDLAKCCREKEIHTILDTTGFAGPSVIERMAHLFDLFLYDIKLMDEDQHRHYTGVSNRPVVANLKRLAQKNKNIIIRFPVIPGITDSESNIKQVADLVDSLKTIRQINLLPYHPTAKNKYRLLDIPYLLEDVKPPTVAHMNKIKKMFEQFSKNMIIVTH